MKITAKIEPLRVSPEGITRRRVQIYFDGRPYELWAWLPTEMAGAIVAEIDRLNTQDEAVKRGDWKIFSPK